MTSKKSKTSSLIAPGLGNHKACVVCAHPQREQIERDFISWRNPTEITKYYNLPDKASVYRHAHVLGLVGKRSRNLRAALERLVERVDQAPVTANSVLQAVVALARINSEGKLTDGNVQLGMNELFERMTTEELTRYAATGELPVRFKDIAGATPSDGPAGDEYE